MATAIETEPLHIFQTQAMTDYGPQDFWLDESCNWRSSIADPDFTLHLVGCSWAAVGEIFEPGQTRRALTVADSYLGEEYRQIAEILGVDNGRESVAEWHGALERLNYLQYGLHQFLHGKGRVDGGGEDRDFALGFLPVGFTLGRDRREFLLSGISHWEELGDGLPDSPEVPVTNHTRLINVLEFTNDARPGERAAIVSAHVDLVRLYASHLRNLVNKVRSGANLCSPELERIGFWSASVLNLCTELEEI